MGKHEHDPNPAKIEVNNIIKKLKTDAVQTEERPCKIITKNIAGASIAVKLQLPTKEAMIKSIKRAKNDNDCVPLEPKSIDDFIIPDKFINNMSMNLDII